jgi:hypothetical protein
MNRQTRKRAIRVSVLVPLGGALAFAAAGLALAAPTALVPAVGYPLRTLTIVGRAYRAY